MKVVRDWGDMVIVRHNGEEYMLRGDEQHGWSLFGPTAECWRLLGTYERFGQALHNLERMRCDTQ